MVVVAACQIPASIGTNDHGPLVAAVREAAGRGADLVVLPELAVCGYVFHTAAEARAAAQDLDGPTVTLLKSLSRDLGVVLVCGFAELGEDGEVYNAAVLVEDGSVRTRYRKAHLWGREPEFFRAGDQPPAVVETAIGRIAVMICYDLEFPEWVRLTACAGADLIAVPANWPLDHHPVPDRAIEVVKAQAAAATNRTYVVVADRCGRARGVDWIGGSLIAADTGHLLAGPATGVAAPAVLTCHLDPATARDKSAGPHNDVMDDRRLELYQQF
ncbi:nitrilase-related carbon-nitrogen hydrolase [Lentzea sp. NPDC058450]|uniref:nitrilase-related carbon-nitrogen hydrolase n=1 Tax=Lentzea sp. NPDC058450 TaxID=3346505 RepID=UPI00365039D1